MSIDHRATPEVLGLGDGPVASIDQSFRVAHCLSVETAYVEIEGALDVLTSPRLGEVLSMILQGRIRPKRMVLDLSRVSFMDSTGYLAIDEVTRSYGWKGELEIKDPSPPVKRVFDLIREMTILS